jgi:non-canonical poly(A) RNA polymerase PAPD5/7
VTSLLQHMPRNQERNIGSLLLEFFHFYGKVFNFEKTGIRMNPPGFYNKVSLLSWRKSIGQSRSYRFYRSLRTGIACRLRIRTILPTISPVVLKRLV